MQIGFIGLGRMGLPVAANLAAAGHQVFATDTRGELADPAATADLRWFPTAAAVAGRAEVLVTMLPGPDECRIAMLAHDGAALALRPGAAWLDLTSNSPTVGAELAAVVTNRGVGVLEVPVGGDPAAAAAGTLTL